jgi:hypothetical protein
LLSRRLQFGFVHEFQRQPRLQLQSHAREAPRGIFGISGQNSHFH